MQKILVLHYSRNAHAAAGDLHASIVRMRATRDQLAALAGREEFPLAEDARALVESLTAWEGRVIQVKQETFQDVINFPNRLNAELLDLVSKLDGNGPALTAGLRSQAAALLGRAADAQDELATLGAEVAAFNEAFRAAALPTVELPAVGLPGR